jgi:hypothetical protein
MEISSSLNFQQSYITPVRFFFWKLEELGEGGGRWEGGGREVGGRKGRRGGQQ